jgi:hemolysin activation/secretion protein
MRYQGKSTYLIETELRWDWNLRWSLIGFTGYGETQPVNKDIFDKQSAYNYGLGIRYLLAREYGLRMGIDIARGPEQWAFYIQFGSSWFAY